MHATWLGSEAGWEPEGGRRLDLLLRKITLQEVSPEGSWGGLNCGCSRVFYYIKYYVSPDSQFYVLFPVSRRLRSFSLNVGIQALYDHSLECGYPSPVLNVTRMLANPPDPSCLIISPAPWSLSPGAVVSSPARCLGLPIHCVLT